LTESVVAAAVAVPGVAAVAADAEKKSLTGSVVAAAAIPFLVVVSGETPGHAAAKAIVANSASRKAGSA